MNTKANLTHREQEIAELFAWGASKKDVATHLYISERTVENHARNIYQKIGCNKVNELSAWWFCHRFCIPLNLSPLARQTTAVLLLAFYIYGASNLFSSTQIVRLLTPRITCVRSVRSRNKDNDLKFTA